MYVTLPQLLYLCDWEEQRGGGVFKVIIWEKGGKLFEEGLIPQLIYLNYLPTSASFGVKRVL